MLATAEIYNRIFLAIKNKHNFDLWADNLFKKDCLKNNLRTLLAILILRDLAGVV